MFEVGDIIGIPNSKVNFYIKGIGDDHYQGEPLFHSITYTLDIPKNQDNLYVLLTSIFRETNEI